MNDQTNLTDEANLSLNPFYCQLEGSFPVLIKADENDPYTVFLEASNEAKDQQKDILFMKALEAETENFLRKGVISWDHLHKVKNDPGYIVGEPLDVKFSFKEPKATLVKAKLYKAVDYANKIVNMLKSASTRLGASVGGFIQQRKPLSKSSFGIFKVLWDELAITYKPINDATLGNVSLIPIGAFAKALMVGSGTDAATFTGGRSLIPESVQGGVKGTKFPFDWARSVLNGVVAQIAKGKIKSHSDLKKHLEDVGALFLYTELAEARVQKLTKLEVANGKQGFRFR